jgi:hypothetical protein
MERAWKEEHLATPLKNEYRESEGPCLKAAVKAPQALAGEG